MFTVDQHRTQNTPLYARNNRKTWALQETNGPKTTLRAPKTIQRNKHWKWRHIHRTFTKALVQTTFSLDFHHATKNVFSHQSVLRFAFPDIWRVKSLAHCFCCWTALRFGVKQVRLSATTRPSMLHKRVWVRLRWQQRHTHTWPTPVLLAQLKNPFTPGTNWNSSRIEQTNCHWNFFSTSLPWKKTRRRESRPWFRLDLWLLEPPPLPSPPHWLFTPPPRVAWRWWQQSTLAFGAKSPICLRCE